MNVITSGKFITTVGNNALSFSCHLPNIAHESCRQWPQVHAITQFLNATMRHARNSSPTDGNSQNVFNQQRYQNDASIFELRHYRVLRKHQQAF